MDNLLEHIVMRANWLIAWIAIYGTCDDCANDSLFFCLHKQAKAAVHTPHRRRDGFDGWHPTYDANYDNIDWSKK